MATTSPKVPTFNAIGANHAHKRELDDTAISRAGVIFVDSIEQSKQEAGDLIVPFQQQPQKWDVVHELDQLVAGKVPGRTSEKQITLFKSNGIASWDLAVAEKVYALARQKNLGRELPFFFFRKITAKGIKAGENLGGRKPDASFRERGVRRAPGMRLNVHLRVQGLGFAVGEWVLPHGKGIVSLQSVVAPVAGALPQQAACDQQYAERDHRTKSARKAAHADLFLLIRGKNRSLRDCRIFNLRVVHRCVGRCRGRRIEIASN